MFKKTVVLMMIVVSTNLCASVSMRYNCEDDKGVTFDIEVFDMEYRLAFLNRTGLEQIVLNYNEEQTSFSSKNQQYLVAFDNVTQIDEDGEGEVSGFYKFPTISNKQTIKCQAFGF